MFLKLLFFGKRQRRPTRFWSHHFPSPSDLRLLFDPSSTGYRRYPFCRAENALIGFVSQLIQQVCLLLVLFGKGQSSIPNGARIAHFDTSLNVNWREDPPWRSTKSRSDEGTSRICRSQRRRSSRATFRGRCVRRRLRARPGRTCLDRPSPNRRSDRQWARVSVPRRTYAFTQLHEPGFKPFPPDSFRLM
jgi:hypothetical protein